MRENRVGAGERRRSRRSSILTRGKVEVEVGGDSGRIEVFKKMLIASPFSLPTVFSLVRYFTARSLLR